MTVYWSASAPGFYNTDYYPEENVPADKVEVSQQDYVALLEAQSAGKIIVTDPATGGAMAVDPTPPVLTIPEQATRKMNSPVIVECASLTDLSSTYANTDQARANATTVVSQINAGMGLPGGGATFNWPDADNVAHAWPEDEFKSFAKALANYIYELQQVANGFSDILPSNTLSI